VTRFAEALYAIAITLWVGSLVAIGVAASVLFDGLTDRTLAGAIAGKLYTLVAFAGMAFGTYLLLYLVIRRGWRAIKSSVFWIVLVMLILAMVGHFGIQPVIAQIKAEQRLAEATVSALQKVDTALHAQFLMWHGISMALYLLQSLLGLWLVVWQERGKR